MPVPGLFRPTSLRSGAPPSRSSSSGCGGESNWAQTAFKVLTDYAARLDAAEGRLYLSGIEPRVMSHFMRAGHLSAQGPIQLYEATPNLGESTLAALHDAERLDRGAPCRGRGLISRTDCARSAPKCRARMAGQDPPTPRDACRGEGPRSGPSLRFGSPSCRSPVREQTTWHRRCPRWSTHPDPSIRPQTGSGKRQKRRSRPSSRRRQALRRPHRCRDAGRCPGFREVRSCPHSAPAARQLATSGGGHIRRGGVELDESALAVDLTVGVVGDDAEQGSGCPVDDELTR